MIGQDRFCLSSTALAALSSRRCCEEQGLVSLVKPTFTMSSSPLLASSSLAPRMPALIREAFYTRS